MYHGIVGQMNGYGMGLNPVRCAAITARTRQIFPHLRTLGEPEYWTGLRPATPSNVPIIGRAPLANLYLNTGHGTRMIPDFVKLADAYGCLAIRVTKQEEVDAAIALALETNDRPVVIDFVVSRDAMVWPMVPQGLSNSEVQYARDHAPEWEED